MRNRWQPQPSASAAACTTTTQAASRLPPHAPSPSQPRTPLQRHNTPHVRVAPLPPLLLPLPPPRSRPRVIVLSWSDGTRGSPRLFRLKTQTAIPFRLKTQTAIPNRRNRKYWRTRRRSAISPRMRSCSACRGGEQEEAGCQGCVSGVRDVMCCSSRSRAVAALNCKKSASHSLSRAVAADKDGNRSGAGEESAVRVLLVKACAVQLSQPARHAFGCPVLNRAGNQSRFCWPAARLQVVNILPCKSVCRMLTHQSTV